MSTGPDFLIIGAMKAATTTVYEQLSYQPGIFMAQPKEPNFFSDDINYARGIDWYGGLFDGARPGDLLGEASTHYTKLPTYPDTVARMKRHLSGPRFVYLMRDPVERLISQYIHQWSEGEIRCGLEQAVARHPELVAYSRYGYQLGPYFEAFGRDSVLPVFFEALGSHPQRELERICRFIGYRGTPQWRFDLEPSNVSRERVRRFPLHGVLVESPLATRIRRRFVPKPWREAIRRRLTMRRRPELSDATRRRLEALFDDDLGALGDWLGFPITCCHFRAMAEARKS